MKKTLLTVLGVGLVLATTAQTAKFKPSGMSKDGAKPRAVREESANPIFKKASAVKAPATEKSSRAFGRAQFPNYLAKSFTSSANAFGLLTSYQTVISANQDLGALLFVNRLSSTWKPAGNNSGWIYNKWSTDGGTTWDSLYVADEVGNTKRSRYPGGVIMNIKGNTNIDYAKSMSSGPWVNGGSSLWEGSFYSVAKLDQSYNIANTPANPVHDFFQPNLDGTDTEQITRAFARNNHTAVDNNAWVGSYLGYIDGDDASWSGIALDHFEMQSDYTYSWTVDEITVPVKRDVDGIAESGWIPYVAFGPSGNVGYAMTTGVLEGAEGRWNSYLPIVYKTIDGGATWNPFLQNTWETDFAGETILGDYNEFNPVGGNDTTFVKPFFGSAQGMDMAVDANNHLHIFCEIGSGSSVSDDSLGYSWTYSGFRRLYDVHTTDGQNGVYWDVMPVDTIWTDPAQGNDVGNSPWSDGDGGQLDLDARLQISRTDDGTKLFYSWADSDPGLSSGFNTVPEIYLRGFNVSTEKFTDTYQASDDAGQAFWFYASDIALTSGNSYNVPLTFSINDARDGVAPVYHALICSATFTDADFMNNIPTSPNPTGYDNGYANDMTISIKDIKKANNAVVVSPNPFATSTNISVSLAKAEKISVEVVNSLGAVVYSTTVNGNSGKNNITVNASNLSSGVYFYNVTAGETVSTGKLVIQK